ncbi:MAG: acyl-CoA dehydrogenase family protein [Comamonas sp.]
MPPLSEPTAPDAPARARELAARFAALAAHHDETGEPPAAQVQALFEAGLLRLTVARRDGGEGAGLGLARQVVQAVAEGDPSVALILSMHYAQHAAIAHARRRADDGVAPSPWPRALADRVVADTLRGPALINALQVEPELGSPSHGGLPAATARRDPAEGGWRLSGRKIYSTGSHLLAWYSVLAVTDEPEPRVGHFLVPRGSPGVRIEPTWDPLGMRATASHDVVFEDTPVAAGQAANLYPAADGVRRDEHGFGWYLNLVGSVYIATAIAARDWLLRFLNERRPTALGGAALASLPTVQDAVGRIELLIHAATGLLDAHARAFDAGEPSQPLGLAARQTAVEHAARATALALELAGNHGISRRNALERHYRNAQCAQIHAPASALVRANLGRAALQRLAA